MACSSALRRASRPLRIKPIRLDTLQAQGLYSRPLERRPSGLWDPISQAPMATEFAVARFFLPHILPRRGWALFTDCDVLWRRDPWDLFALADPRYAIQVVQHPPIQGGPQIKMDGVPQTFYSRKNWSSVMLWNLEHPAHDRLTISMLNSRPGRDLHAFCWLEDEQIGALPPAWNWLEGYSPDLPGGEEPALIHYTRGGPWFVEWQHVRYADLWRQEWAWLQGKAEAAAGLPANA